MSNLRFVLLLHAADAACSKPNAAVERPEASLRGRVLTTLRTAPAPLHRSRIAELVGAPLKSVSSTLSALRSAGAAGALERGHWRTA